MEKSVIDLKNKPCYTCISYNKTFIFVDISCNLQMLSYSNITCWLSTGLLLLLADFLIGWLLSSDH